MSNSFSTINPASNQKIKDWVYASVENIQDGITELTSGFQIWKTLSPQQRQTKLLAVVGQISLRKNHFARSISEQMGKPIAQSLAEVQKTIDAAHVLCEMNLDFLNAKSVESVYSSSDVTHEPMGVIVGIMPWNLPLWQAFRMIFPALLAGNTIVLKASEITPEIGTLIEDCFQVLNSQHTVLKSILFSHEHTEFILSQSCVAGVSLTGSTNAGKTVGLLAGKYLKKAIFELGGSDPYLVLQDADLKWAAQKIIQSRMNNCGQVCISAKRALVSTSQLTEFISYCQAELKKMKMGDPFLESTEIGPLAHLKFKNNYLKQIQDLKPLAADFIECATDQHKFSAISDSAYVQPYLLVFTQNHSVLKNLEIFGPALIIIVYETVDQAIEIANSTEFGLGAAVFSKDIEFAKQISRSIIAGQVAINDVVKSDVHLPFGGFKMSGYGRELGISGFFEFTQTQVISVGSSS